MQEHPVSSAPSSRQDTSSQKQARPQRPRAFYASICMLLLVVAVTLGFWGLQMRMHSEIQEKRTTITALENDIARATSNTAIMIAHILEKNLLRPSIDLEKMVEDFRNIGRDAGVRFRGFHIAGDLLSTELIASTSADPSNHQDPVTAIIEMMRTYNEKNAQAEVPNAFRLEPILKVMGDPSTRTSTIQFTITPISSY